MPYSTKLRPDLREKLREIAFAWHTTEKALLEAFIRQLPQPDISRPATPTGMEWVEQATGKPHTGEGA